MYEHLCCTSGLKNTWQNLGWEKKTGILCSITKTFSMILPKGCFFLSIAVTAVTNYHQLVPLFPGPGNYEYSEAYFL